MGGAASARPTKSAASGSIARPVQNGQPGIKQGGNSYEPTRFIRGQQLLSRTEDGLSVKDFIAIRHLVSIPAWLNSKVRGCNPLQAAIISKDIATIDILVDAGVSTKFHRPKDSAMKKLLDDGIAYIAANHDLYTVNYFQYTEPEVKAGEEALLAAADGKVPEDLSAVGKTDEEPPVQQDEKVGSPTFPLHDAARVGDTESILIFLLTRRCDPLQKDDFGNIAVYYSALNGHALACAYLLLAMGGIEKVEDGDRQRCQKNSSDAKIKRLFESSLLPEGK